MNYMGGKFMIAKHIVPIMLKHMGVLQWWVEPFVGGGNVIDKVTGDRIGGDANKWTIEALVAIRDRSAELPKDNTEFTEEDYKNLRSGEHAIKGFAGFAYSFGAKWLGGWRRNNLGRDYVAEGFRNAAKQSPGLQGAILVNKPYRDLHIPSNSLIYCDPPYAGTTGYKDRFDSGAFFDWCRLKAKDGHTVFVSEYSAPSDFICLWEKPVSPGLRRSSGSKRTEKLFLVKQ